MDKFCERLKELRIEKNLSIEALSKDTGLSKSGLSYWENGKRVPMTDEEGNPVYVFDITAPENEAIFHRVQVGNEDLIYKLIHGYQCYATGSYGTSSKVEYEGSSAEYIICKTLWRTSLLSKGTVLPAESYSTEE